MKKKSLVLFIAVLLALILSACGSDDSSKSKDSSPKEGDIIYESQKTADSLDESIARARELLDSYEHEENAGGGRAGNPSYTEEIDDVYDNERDDSEDNEYVPDHIDTSEPGYSVVAAPEGSHQSGTNTNTGGNVGQSGEYGFDLYYNPEQQNTTDQWVLNNNPDRMVIHHPDCPSVAQIKPENYATSNESIDDLKNKGYRTCGNCF